MTNGYFQDIPEPNFWWTIYWAVAGVMFLVMLVGLGAASRTKSYTFWRYTYGVSQALLIVLIWPITAPMALGWIVDGAMEEKSK